jgi:hypothetical protein
VPRELHLLAFGNTRSAGPWRHPDIDNSPAGVRRRLPRHRSEGRQPARGAVRAAGLPRTGSTTTGTGESGTGDPDIPDRPGQHRQRRDHLRRAEQQHHRQRGVRHHAARRVRLPMTPDVLAADAIGAVILLVGWFCWTARRHGLGMALAVLAISVGLGPLAVLECAKQPVK